MVERTCATCGETLHNIVELTQHFVQEDCDRILRVEDMTPKERGTLLYLEERVVNHEGWLDYEQMNHVDHTNLKPMQAIELVGVEETEVNPVKEERIRNTPGRIGDGQDAKVVHFPDRAWDLARDCRQMHARAWIDEGDVELGEVPVDGRIKAVSTREVGRGEAL